MNSTNQFRSKLLKEDLYSINAEKYAKELKNNSNIVIWGSCSTGQLVYDFLKEFRTSNNVKYFADNNKAKWGTKQNGLLVLSPEEVVKKVKEDSDTYIIVAAVHLVEIKRQLLSLGIEDNAIDIKGYGVAKGFFVFNKKTPYEIINSRMNDYEKVYSYLSDKRSRDVYLGILNCKISLDNNYLAGIASPNEEQYFEKEIIKISENEIFCDCGSFNGDTLETFITLSGGKYKKYIAIEADKEIYTQLNEKIIANGYKNVQTHNIACWNEKTVLKFQSSQSSGHITETGDISVSADILDDIIKDGKVTFLKMDIEGAEEMALKGASSLIKNNKPILAICLYHSLEDYYRLPLIMKDLNPEYKLFIRHYTDMVDVETVCYAIPKERLL